ncbi:aminoacyl-tRNA hydrolase [Hyphococcus flavus]|uniref:Peptidyl-tRNA hydrolase n=1 Tax=Hyphococcus flavus TaxID=1866326 RepID=A0AAE9ZB36_9PROT|nr:aminoacyl-tRNA hydrolase [Hyphococcus flavus]WDI31223.1 aminoacyl-tRNA hydrolase [Hyphococcus flavus]
MLLLVGLGNPGEKYARHRHNVGFMAADAIADAHGFDAQKSKFRGELREGFLAGPAGRTKALILKPQTYMNESGRSVGEALRFYKLPPEDVFVFYDELDLAPGKLRVKTGGGAAGHNGIRSIEAHIGNEFHRIRIGIGHPGDKSRVTGHVLGDFAKTDYEWLSPMLDAIAQAAPLLSDENSNKFASSVAQNLVPNRSEPAKAENSTTGTNTASARVTDEKTTKNPFADALQNLLRGKE